MRPLHLHTFAPSVAPSLSFVGLSWRAIRPQQFQLQGQLLARLLSGAAAPLPPAAEMLALAEAELRALDRADIPRRYAHCMASFMPQDEWEFAFRLVAAAAAAGGSAGRKQLQNGSSRSSSAADVRAAAAAAEVDEEGVAAAAADAVAADGLLFPPAWLITLAEVTGPDILERPDSFRDTFTPGALEAMAAADEGCRQLLERARAQQAAGGAAGQGAE